MYSKDVFKKRIYEIVEVGKKGDIASQAYDSMMLMAVIIGLLPLTVKSFNWITATIDIITIVIFAFDYVVRIYTSDFKMGIKSYKAYLYYAFTPMAIIDFLSVVPVVEFFVPDTSMIALIRVFRVLQLLKLTRYSKTMVTIINVIKKVKNQIGAVILLTIIYILAIALIIFRVEPTSFSTFLDAVYWAAVSITTIGYGDISPVSQLGRLITVVSALVGMAVIALPTGIITAAYMQEISRKKSHYEL